MLSLGFCLFVCLLVGLSPLKKKFLVFFHPLYEKESMQGAELPNCSFPRWDKALGVSLEGWPSLLRIELGALQNAFSYFPPFHLSEA